MIAAADLTATFKIRKVALQREGFELAAGESSADSILYRHDEATSYLPLSDPIRERIRTGALRL